MVAGGAGADTLSAGAGADSLLGGAGNDQLVGGPGSNDLQGEEGHDHLYGGAGGDNMAGGPENDILHGGGDHDVMSGGDGDDRLLAGPGIYGVIAIGDAGNDILVGGDGVDVPFGDAGDDSVIGGALLDVLDGGDGLDSLYADAGADTVTGGLGDDFISGDDGDDWLDGGAGADTLLGGAGDDTFVYSPDIARGGRVYESRDTRSGDVGTDRLRMAQEVDAKVVVYDRNVYFDGRACGITRQGIDVIDIATGAHQQTVYRGGGMGTTARLNGRYRGTILVNGAAASVPDHLDPVVSPSDGVTIYVQPGERLQVVGTFDSGIENYIDIIDVRTGERLVPWNNQYAIPGGTWTSPVNTTGGLVAYRINTAHHDRPYISVPWVNNKMRVLDHGPDSVLLGWEDRTDNDYNDAVTRLTILPG